MLRIIESILRIAFLVTLSVVGIASGQSLADAARANRQQKEVNTNKAKKVVETDDLTPAPEAKGGPQTSINPNQTPDQWKNQILAQKAWVRYLQGQVDRLKAQDAKEHDGGGPPPPKQVEDEQTQQLQKAQNQLAIEKKKLDNLQAAASQAGMPSSVVNPSQPPRFMKSKAGVLRDMRMKEFSH